MQRFTVLVSAGLAGCSGAATPATKPAVSSINPGEDSGVFDLSMAGSSSGTETFRIAPTSEGLSYTYELISPLSANIGSGTATVDSQWRPIRAEFKSATAAETVASAVGGDPLTLRQSILPAKLGASITAKIRPLLSLADDSVIQFAAFCAVPRTGEIKAFPSIRVAVTQTHVAPDAGVWLLDLEGKGQVTVLCSRGKLLELTENTKNFRALRRGAEDAISATRQALRPVGR